MVTDSTQRTTLVMVDDDAEDVLMMRTAARRAGHDVRILHLAAGRELLDAFSQASLPERCVVLLDLNMPAMDGFAVLDRLRRLPRGELLPVVVFTSSSDQLHVERAFASGANAFLTKPSTLKETADLMGALVTHWLVHGQVPSGVILPQERTVADPRPAQRLLVLAPHEDLADDIGVLLRGMARGWEIDSITRVEFLAARLSTGRYDAWMIEQSMAQEAVAWLAQIPLEARPPVVMVTTGQGKDLEALQMLGAVDSLSREEMRPALLDRTLRFAVAQWRSQRALERSQQDLLRSERMATIGRMASGVAHEYNNLNAVVLAGLERLDQHIINDLHAHQLISRVLGAIERSRRISESLMTLGRSTTEGAIGTINLRLHLADSLALLDLRARRLGARLRLESDDTPCLVHMDSNDLQQVLSNLVVNALHAVHCATDPAVVVRLDLREDRAILSVSDNGVGIPPEDMPRLFQPFFSRKAVQGRNGLFPTTIEGTGLGLSVCQVLIERAGGELTINSRVGLGTTVTVSLPITGDSPVVVTSAIPADPPSLLAATRTRVVVLDDNAVLCQLLHEGLSDAGFLVRSHIDPQQFLAEEDLEAIDVLILDWLMPGLTGGEVLMRLGNPARKTSLRVLVVSGEEPEIPSPLPPGVAIVAVMLKPYRLGDLIGRLTGT